MTYQASSPIKFPKRAPYFLDKFGGYFSNIIGFTPSQDEDGDLVWKAEINSDLSQLVIGRDLIEDECDFEIVMRASRDEPFLFPKIIDLCRRFGRTSMYNYVSVQFFSGRPYSRVLVNRKHYQFFAIQPRVFRIPVMDDIQK